MSERFKHMHIFVFVQFFVLVLSSHSSAVLFSLFYNTTFLQHNNTKCFSLFLAGFSQSVV